MIVGVGIDVVDVDRFIEATTRTPGMVTRLFVPAERVLDGAARRPESLAGRFAVKEALAKALGAPGGLRWTDAEVVADDTGRPGLRISGTVAARARELGVAHLHVSIAHDAGIATAIVVAEA